MKISVRLFLFCLCLKTHAACDFKPSVKSVISLSGSSTVLIKELGLLSNKKLKGISVFNPISEKEFSGKIYPGGIFLSQSSLKELSDSVVFFDESRELKRIFSSLSTVTIREVKTRNLNPKESVEKTIKTLKEFLRGCDQEILLVEKKVESLENELLTLIKNTPSVIFYLGEFRNARYPETVIVNDGVVKWLIDQKKIRTYPSQLAYVNWSAKILNEMPKDTQHVAIKDSGREMIREIKESPQGVTLIYPGALVPGVTQLEAFLYWAKTH